jgi:hypothetical protein
MSGFLLFVLGAFVATVALAVTPPQTREKVFDSFDLRKLAR